MSDGRMLTMPESDFKEALRRSREAAWDAAVGCLTYPDGSKVELMSNTNPYRKEESK